MSKTSPLDYLPIQGYSEDDLRAHIATEDRMGCAVPILLGSRVSTEEAGRIAAAYRHLRGDTAVYVSWSAG